MSFSFGDFELDQERRQLLRSGEPVPLEPKAYELLGLLLERRPRALPKAQIRDVVWPQTFVSESTLAVAVNGIREALGDDARHPRFIRTVGPVGLLAGLVARRPLPGGHRPQRERRELGHRPDLGGDGREESADHDRQSEDHRPPSGVLSRRANAGLSPRGFLPGSQVARSAPNERCDAGGSGKGRDDRGRSRPR